MLDLLCTLWSYFVFFLALTAIISWTTFLLPLIWQARSKEQDFKAKYNAKWAVVTGGSSGIGRAIVEKLAQQGINVILVALEDELLNNFHQTLKRDFPKLEFRKVGVNLADDSFFPAVVEATKDLDVSLLFNNAGYITVGLFPDVSLDRQLKNYSVNATAAIKLTHHFVGQLLQKKQKGAVFFTSSPAGLMPCPFSIMYGATKAFLTNFATSLACEVKNDGIDVLVVHPSPVDTNFYNSDTAHKSQSLLAFRKTATAPTTIADIMFSSVGKGVVRDQGYFSLGLKALLKTVDINFLCAVLPYFTHWMPDYKKLRKDRVA